MKYRDVILVTKMDVQEVYLPSYFVYSYTVANQHCYDVFISFTMSSYNFHEKRNIQMILQLIVFRRAD